MKVYRTILLDDHRGFRRTLLKVLSRYPFIEVVAEAENGEEALDKVKIFSPDLVTVDINLPGMNGFELTRLLKEQHPGTRVIFIAFNGNPVFERKAKELDCPYIPKEMLLEDLDNALLQLNVEPKTCLKACEQPRRNNEVEK